MSHQQHGARADRHAVNQCRREVQRGKGFAPLPDHDRRLHRVALEQHRSGCDQLHQGRVLEVGEVLAVAQRLVTGDEVVAPVAGQGLPGDRRPLEREHQGEARHHRHPFDPRLPHRRRIAPEAGPTGVYGSGDARVAAPRAVAAGWPPCHSRSATATVR